MHEIVSRQLGGERHVVEPHPLGAQDHAQPLRSIGDRNADTVPAPQAQGQQRIGGAIGRPLQFGEGQRVTGGRKDRRQPIRLAAREVAKVVHQAQARWFKVERASRYSRSS